MNQPDDPQSLHRELARMRHIVEASQALHTTLDLDELLGLILDVAKQGVHADRGTVFLVSVDGKELWSKVLSGDQDLEIRLPMGQGLAGSVAQTSRTVNIPDAYEDPRFDRSWDDKSGYRTRQLLTAPIRNREGTVVGVFQLLNREAGAFDAEDEAFLDALSIHVALAVENARLHRAALEKERQDREIALVQSVQRAYLPERLEGECGVFTYAGMNQLCEDASGDYYDAILLQDGRTAVVMGDVSGHGLGAALVMSQARALLHALVPSAESLSSLLAQLNDFLAPDMTRGRFMTLFLGVADPETGELAWNNAGHPPPLLARAGSGEVERLGSQGLILGVLPGITYTKASPVTMAPGDVLLLYTDGATEAVNADETMLEEEGLAEVLRRVAARDPPAILDGIRAALVEWTGREDFTDDLTLLALKRV
jgi:phosphoserine phosphatase